MKIAVCSAQSYGRQFLSEVNRKFEYELTFFDSHLCEETRQMVAGFPAVCAFVSNMLDALVLEAAARGSTMSIFQRVARSGAYPASPDIVPLAVPLLAGPAASSHVMANSAHGIPLPI